MRGARPQTFTFEAWTPIQSVFLIAVTASLDMAAEHGDLFMPLVHEFNRRALAPALKTAWERDGFIPPRWTAHGVRSLISTASETAVSSLDGHAAKRKEWPDSERRANEASEDEQPS